MSEDLNNNSVNSLYENNHFTWLLFFRGLLIKICSEYDKKSLNDVFDKIFKDKFQNSPGLVNKSGVLDPFTFIAFLNSNDSISQGNRQVLCDNAKNELNLSLINTPNDFDGIPIFDAQSQRYFFNKSKGTETVDLLWQIAKSIVNNNGEIIDNIGKEIDNEIQKISSKNTLCWEKISKILFICFPKKYFPADKHTRSFANWQKNISNFEDFKNYQVDLKNKFNESPYDVSYKAWLKKQAPVKYWAAGHHWGTSDNVDQYARFVRDGIWEDGWVKNHSREHSDINILNKIRPGDYIVLKTKSIKGQKTIITGIGKILGRKDHATFMVNWLVTNIHKCFSKNEYGSYYGKTIAEIRDDNFINGINKIIKEYEDKKMEFANNCKKLLEHSHNIILHGAPGTGKTYLARQIAESMGAETCFVQFHPSYDYTDFVEGLRPAKDSDSKNIYFEKTDGIFKNLCIKALENALSPKKDNFDEIYKKLIDMIIESEEPLILETLSKKKPFSLEVNSKNNIYAIPQTETKTKMSISQEILKEYLRTGKILDWKTYLTVLGQIMLDLGYKKEFDEVEKKNFVIIIDEINRGEMSKIFGELFFSIDPDYRVSKQDIDNHIKGKGKLTVITTQYSSMEPSPNVFDIALGHDNDGDYGHFFVPENVYIIGTMNDIDRNVESMDFAIRRRFAFKEIEAKDTQESILANMPNKDKLIKCMDNLNNAISGIEGLSSAYHIGAAYFLKYDSSKDETTAFDELWNYHLKPLLQEYLRGMEDAEQKLKKLEAEYNEGFKENKTGTDNNQTEVAEQ